MLFESYVLLLQIAFTISMLVILLGSKSSKTAFDLFFEWIRFIYIIYYTQTSSKYVLTAVIHFCPRGYSCWKYFWKVLDEVGFIETSSSNIGLLFKRHRLKTPSPHTILSHNIYNATCGLFLSSISPDVSKIWYSRVIFHMLLFKCHLFFRRTRTSTVS